MRNEHPDSALASATGDAPLDERWVQAAPFRAHVRHALAVADVPWPAFALESDVSINVVRSLLFGRRGRSLGRLPPRIAARLLRVDGSRLASLRRSQVSAVMTTARLRALLASGAEPVGLARWCGLTEWQFDSLVRGVSLSCSRLTETLALAAERSLSVPEPGSVAA